VIADVRLHIVGHALCSINVMPGLVPGIHVFLRGATKDVDGRDEPGHDD
jgi:hypothetical protein